MPWRCIGEWRYSSMHSLTSALDGGEWSASRPGRFTSSERSPGTYWIGCWLGPRTVLNAVVKRKIPSPRRESNSRTPIVQPVAQRYTDWAVRALNPEDLDLEFHRRESLKIWNNVTDLYSLHLATLHAKQVRNVLRWENVDRIQLAQDRISNRLLWTW
jgi:hypothetical protein